MKDTSHEFVQLQRNIIHNMSTRERIKNGADMIDFVYMVVKNRIKSKNETNNETNVVAELFKEYYKNDFSKNEITEIMAFIERRK